MHPETVPTRYRSALGDGRERQVPCTSCHLVTYALDSLCDRCFADGLVDGDELIITVGAGVFRPGALDTGRFAGSVEAGTVGTFRAGVAGMLANWLAIEVDATLVATPDAEGLRDVDVAIVPLTPGQVARPAR